MSKLYQYESNDLNGTPATVIYTVGDDVIVLTEEDAADNAEHVQYLYDGGYSTPEGGETSP